MKLKIHTELLIRVPQFPITAKLTDEWERLKQSISLSSEDFYQQIKDITAEELDQLPRAIYHSIWKYFNRAKYRATPYGSFAGCGYVKTNSSGDNAEILIEKYQNLHVYHCWSTTDGILPLSEEITGDTVLYNNSSFYRIGSQIRFLIREEGTFLLAEMPCTEQIQQVLEKCSGPVSVKTLLDQNKEIHIDFLRELIDQQLLLTDRHANIIGQDYFKRIGYKPGEEDAHYILAERKIKASNLSSESFENVSALIPLLNSLVPEPGFDELSEFKVAFRKKFENRIVPLLVALDPEVGIGYGHLDSAINIADPIERDQTSSKVRSEGLDKLLFKALIRQGNSTIDIESLIRSDASQHLPVSNSFGMLCTIADDLLIIEQICTPTSNRINGRFSLAGNDIHSMCLNIAKAEQDANPNVLFFDIGYTDEVNVDNINRRKNIYPFQLALLNFNSGQPLNLNEIDVALDGDELILYSRQFRKRIVPRLASGYNYKRSTLSVFRFLCDLQYDGLKSNFDLRLPNYFPGQDYYPRVQFRNIIISPAQWRIDCETLYKDYGPSPGIQELGKYLKKIGLLKYGIIRTEDRTMCIDTEDQGDMIELLHLLKKFGSFLLEEGFIPQSPIVKDDDNNGYNHQLVLTVLNKENIYRAWARPDSPIPAQLDTPKIFLPMNEWIYFEIYTHPLRADQLLAEQLDNYLTRNQARVRNWFFIRYDDNGEHLRLRVRPANPGEHEDLVRDLTLIMGREMEEGIVSDIKICTYKREVERYGADLIAQVEQHFYRDSELVMAILQHSLSNEDRYRMAIDLLLSMRCATSYLETNFDLFIDGICRSFAAEHHVSGSGFRNLNNRFKALPMKTIFLNPTLENKFERCKSSAINVLTSSPEDRQIKLAADLFHMHINRLMAAHQRSHEMMIYYFAQKELLRERAFSKELKRGKIRA